MRIVRLLFCLIFFTLPSLIVFAQSQQLDSRKVYEVASSGVVLIKNGDSENGSGFLVNPSGIILTNYHVIEDADSLGAILIKFKDNTIFPCRRILYKDPKKDIAILKIDATGRRTVLPIAPDGIVQQGEDVAAIGCPFGIEFTITKGIISNLMPSPATPYLLQFDASINPGNSGGPILNRNAQVTGMVVSRFEGGGRAQNINFAIKTESLRSALDANNIQYLDSGLIKDVDSISLRFRAAQDSLLNALEQNKIAMQRAQDSINKINEAQKIAQQRSQDSLRDAVEAERQRNLDFQLSIQREQEAQRRLKEMERIRLAGIRDSIERISIIDHWLPKISYYYGYDMGTMQSRRTEGATFGQVQAMFGYRPSVREGASRGTFYAVFGTIGSVSPEGMTQFLRQEVSPDSVFVNGAESKMFGEAEIGIVLKEFFRLSFGLGSQGFPSTGPGSRESYSYYTVSTGLSFHISIVDLDFLTTTRFGGNLPELQVRAGVGVGVRWDFGKW